MGKYSFPCCCFATTKTLATYSLTHTQKLLNFMHIAAICIIITDAFLFLVASQSSYIYASFFFRNSRLDFTLFSFFVCVCYFLLVCIREQINFHLVDPYVASMYVGCRQWSLSTADCNMQF